MKSIFETLQQVGRSLMLPVAVLPVAGILLGVGAAKFGIMPDVLSLMMEQAGGAIFANLPLLFALGVALGLSKNDGVAALASAVGFLIYLATLGVMAKTYGVDTKSILGIDTIDTGVLGGIIIGISTSILYKRFSGIELPPYLGFFGGKRFVPIVTGLASIIIGVLISFIWPPIQTGIDAFSHYATSGNPLLMSFIYGVGERALIPLGLHHIWNVPFFFEIGEFVKANGDVVNGDITRFFAGDKTAGFLGGAFLFKMFGLPAAAIAIWKSAKPENKKAVGGVMLSAALTSFLTGITEPIEFAFLFVAPLLYGIHAILAGFSFVLFYILGAKLGTTFSHGLIDYVLYFKLNTKPELVWIFGPIYGLVYYGTFRFLIEKFNFLTPGREDASSDSTVVNDDELAAELVLAFGGETNIKTIDACITRLRVNLNNSSLMNKQRIKSLGATDVLVMGNGIQAIFGTKSDLLKTRIIDFLSSDRPESSKQQKKFDTINKFREFKFPLTGDIVDLEEVPDQVFSERMMGDGFAIKPNNGIVTAPFDGVVKTVFPTKHAIGLEDIDGKEVLIHVGINTVELEGMGFKSHVKTGDKIKGGDLLLTVDLDYIRKSGKETITPIIFTN